MENECCVVFITTPNINEGREIARKLVEEKLAACVNLVSQVETIYWWEGKIEDTEEVFLVVKTMRDKFEKLESWVRSHHSYKIPEVIALPIVQGSHAFLDWLKGNIQ